MKPLRLTLLCPPLTAAQRAGRFPATDDPLPAAAPGTDEVYTRRITAEPALADLDMGRWAGVSIKHVQVVEPEALKAWLSDPAYRGHGGETFNDLLARVAGWLDAAEGEHGHWRVDAHPWVVRAALARILGLAYPAVQAIDVRPNGRLELAFSDRWRLVVI